MKHKIGITIGDINGVGPEIALKAVSSVYNCIPLARANQIHQNN